MQRAVLSRTDVCLKQICTKAGWEECVWTWWKLAVAAGRAMGQAGPLITQKCAQNFPNRLLNTNNRPRTA